MVTLKRVIRSRPLWLGVLALVGGAFCMGGGCYHQSADEKKFFADIGKISITVYPAYLRGPKSSSYDKAAAEKIAAWLNEHKIADARVADEQVPITGGWSYDESRMWRESRDALGAFAKAHPLETGYAMMPEFLGITDGAHEVVAVHCYTVTREGAYAYGVGLNSHNDIFQSIKPKTVDDCVRAILAQMQQELIDEHKAAAADTK